MKEKSGYGFMKKKPATMFTYTAKKNCNHNHKIVFSGLFSQKEHIFSIITKAFVKSVM